MKKAELEEENKRLTLLVAKQKDYIVRAQKWIYDVCNFIAEENKILTDIENYLRNEDMK